MFGMSEIIRNLVVRKGKSSRRMNESPGRSSSQTATGAKLIKVSTKLIKVSQL